jgi:hypothetical protein
MRLPPSKIIQRASLDRTDALIRSEYVQPQHPPNEEEGDCSDHDVAYPLAERPRFSSILHGTECIRLGEVPIIN